MQKLKSAGGVIFRRHKGTLEWLVVQNAKGKHWGFPKGIIGDNHHNESTEQAACREVAEEAGVAARVVQKITPKSTYIYYFLGEKVTKTVQYFLMEYQSGSPKDHDTEISEAHFVDTETAFATLTFDNDKIILERAIALYKKTAPLV